MRNLHFLILLMGLVAVNAGTKRCYCKAVDANHGYTLIDFGVIDTYKGFLWVRCRRLVDCPNKCHNRVKEWACQNKDQCEAMARGNPIRFHYNAERCEEETSHATLTCGC